MSKRFTLSSMAAVSEGYLFLMGLIPPYSHKPHTNPTHSDLDAQTRDYTYASHRVVDTFEEALLVMALKGDKQLALNIMAAEVTPPVATDFEHLNISSLSILASGTSRHNM
jgi:hypothetical protein